MAEQAQQQDHGLQDGPRAQRDALSDGIGYRPIARPANDDQASRGSPWVLAPWPMLEVVKWVADRLDRYVPGRGNGAVLRRAGADAQEQLQATMHACVLPALRSVRDQLAGEGYPVSLDYEGMGVVLRSRSFNGRVVAYRVEGAVYRAPSFSLIELDRAREGSTYARFHIDSRGRNRERRPRQCSYSAIRRDALHDFRNQLLY